MIVRKEETYRNFPLFDLRHEALDLQEVGPAVLAGRAVRVGESSRRVEYENERCGDVLDQQTLHRLHVARPHKLVLSTNRYILIHFVN